jgi:2-polyprenyl-3-methyl-5-hydroxy-6-metoxy-1,4-benzoquinol methylase
MDELPQAPERFLRRQRQKRHLASLWAGLAGLAPGMTVLDVGCGPGILSGVYAQLVAPGLVYALEPRFALHETPANLRHLPQYASEKIDLPAAPDVIFLTDTLHHMAAPEAALLGLRAVCGAGSKILVAEYDPAGPGIFGPDPARRMARAVVQEMLAAAGFAVVWTVDSADEHYAVLAAPA